MKFSLFSLLFLGGLSGCHGQSTPAPKSPAPPDTTDVWATPDQPLPPYSASGYRATLQRLTARREHLAAQYRRASTPAARAVCLAQARQLFLTTLDSTIFPAWEGTPWDFYGTTWEPRTGSIACGYFVTTALHDAGLHLQRTLLAKQAAETIIANLTSSAHIHRYHALPLGDFVQKVRALGSGLYVVGLDYHVGFLLVSPSGAVEMIHSSVLAPRTVVREEASTSRGLISTYRVVGKLSASDPLLRAWLLEQTLPVHGATVTE